MYVQIVHNLNTNKVSLIKYLSQRPKEFNYKAILSKCIEDRKRRGKDLTPVYPDPRIPRKV